MQEIEKLIEILFERLKKNSIRFLIDLIEFYKY
jgi:hypothetical protein